MNGSNGFTRLALSAGLILVLSAGCRAKRSEHVPWQITWDQAASARADVSTTDGTQSHAQTAAERTQSSDRRATAGAKVVPASRQAEPQRVTTRARKERRDGSSSAPGSMGSDQSPYRLTAMGAEGDPPVGISPSGHAAQAGRAQHGSPPIAHAPAGSGPRDGARGHRARSAKRSQDATSVDRSALPKWSKIQQKATTGSINLVTAEDETAATGSRGVPLPDDCRSAELVAVPSETPGSTLELTLDEAPPCGTATAPSAPGAWYRVMGTGNTIIVTTCNSNTAFDTQISVYCGGCVNLTCVDGNNDALGLDPDCRLGETYAKSAVKWCSQRGEEYLILVHGFRGAAGKYLLEVFDDGEVCREPISCGVLTGVCCLSGDCVDGMEEEVCLSDGGTWYPGEDCVNFTCPQPCDVVCDASGTPEDEVDCGIPVDTVNGGCLSSPPVFSKAVCGEVICGTAGSSYGVRDTDWYEVTVEENTEFTWTVEAEFAAVIGLVEPVVPGIRDCANMTGYVNPYAIGDPCDVLSVTVCLPPGTYWFFVAPQGLYDLSCGSEYQAKLTCAPCKTGACCLTDGRCVIAGADACEVWGGTYRGDGTDCDGPDCCLQPYGGQTDCVDALVTPVPVDGTPVTISGDNSNATTNNCLYAGGWFEGLSIDACADLYLDYCCTDPPADTVYLGVFNNCPACDYVSPTDTSFAGDSLPGCADGNFRSLWASLPAGTYHYPIYSGPDGNLHGPYQLHLTAYPCTRGACCLDGVCIDAFGGTTGRVHCEELGGSWFVGQDCNQGYICPGAVGACCNDGTGVCEDDIVLADCLPPMRFAPNTPCSQLYPPCAGPLGACCMASGCVNETQGDCANRPGLWFGDQDCADFTCPQAPSCPDSAIYGQPVHAPWDPWGAIASDDGPDPDQLLFDNFWEVGAPICDLHWWGFDVGYDGQNLIECTEDPAAFLVTFYKNSAVAAGPGERVCSYELTPARTPTGLLYSSYELNEYSVDLPTCCILDNGWVSIQGIGAPECWFWWTTSGLGDGVSCMDFDTGLDCNVGRDFGFCLTKAEVPIGACCVDGTCLGVMREGTCRQQLGTWFEGEDCTTVTCAPPPCGDSSYPACDGVCPPDSVCVADPFNGSCRCEFVPCEQSAYPACNGECPPGTTCNPMATAALCACVPLPCAPTSDGSRCEAVACPITTEKCVPTVVHEVFGPAPTFEVVKCDCLPGDACHVAFGPGGDVPVWCEGSCPQGFVCKLIATDTDGDQVDDTFECECVQVVIEVDIFPETVGQVLLEMPGPIVTPDSQLPPTRGVYRSAAQSHAVYEGADLQIVLQNVGHRALSEPPPVQINVGSDEVESFQSLAFGTAIITMGTRQGEKVPVKLTGPVQTIVREKADQTTGEFQAEIVSMELAGEIPGVIPIMIRESPTLASSGQTSVQEIPVGSEGEGQFSVESFFDVFTELSVDGGQTWMRATQSVRMTLMQPQLVSAVGPAEAHVWFEGTQEGMAHDDDDDGFDEVDTELVSMSLQGYSPMGPVMIGLRDDIPSMGQIIERANQRPGTLEVAPFDTNNVPADSFFDVWTEIQVGDQVMHTMTSLPLRTLIRHKPPQDGERYVNRYLEPVELIDPTTGQGTGIFVVREVHQPDPTVEHDVFPQSQATMGLEHPNLGLISLIMNGSGEVDVFFEGPQEGDAMDDDLNGRDEVTTQLKTLQLQGNHPVLEDVYLRLNANQITLGQIEENANTQPGRLDLPPFGPLGSTADSFFDVFFEVEIPSQGLVLHNQRPARMEATITHKPPGPGDEYIKIQGPIRLYNRQGELSDIVMTEASHVPNPRIDACCLPDGICEPLTAAVCERNDGIPQGSGTVCTEPQGCCLQDGSCIFVDPLCCDELRGVPQGAGTACRDMTIACCYPDTGECVEVDPLCCDDMGGIPSPIHSLVCLGDHNGNRIDDACEEDLAIEIDVLEETTALVQLTGGPLGPVPVSYVLRGSAEAHVFFEGPVEGMADDDDGDNREEVETQLVSLNLTDGAVTLSLQSDRKSPGQIEELVDNTPGTLDLDPFAPGDADSFFDVFFEIDIGGAVLHNEQALRIQSVITEKPPIARYTHIVFGPAPVELYDANGNPTGVFVVKAEHYTGHIEIDQFDFSIGQFDLIGPKGSETVAVSGPATVHVYFEGAIEGMANDGDNDGYDDVVTEMVALQLTGMTSMGPITVRVHPTIPSIGEIEETVNHTAGILDLPPFGPPGSTADSFFDIFFEVEVGGQLLHTQTPKRMRSRITHKPPGPGDYYENIDRIPLYDAAGNQTPFAIGATRHRPRPPVEIDEFPFSIGEIELTGGPFDGEVVAVTGSTTVAVYFEGQTEGTANDDDSPADSLDEVHTEMIALNLTGNGSLGLVKVGLNPNIASTGEIEERVNHSSGVLDVSPFGPPGSTADSFFDIYFEIEVGGQKFHTIDPKRMRGVITHKPPGPGDFYENLQDIQLYDENGNATGIFLSAGRHRPRPPVEIDEFDLSIGALDLILPGGVTETVEVIGTTQVAVYFEGAGEGSAVDDDTPADGLDEVVTQMTELNLSGFSPLLGSIQVTLNPNIPSMGLIEETVNNAPGVLDVPPFGALGTTADSFFDIYFQVEVAGQTFFTIQPKRMSGRISHKPPGPLDWYENREDIRLYDAAGNETEYFLGAARHRPRPPVEIDEFDFSIGALELILPGGTTETVAVHGTTTVNVFFEGATEGTAGDDGSIAGLDEVVTQMTDLNLRGFSPLLGPIQVTLNPNIASMGLIEETVNNTPGILDVPPFGALGTTADSFFDIYFQVEVAGQTFFTVQPKRMSGRISHKPPGPLDRYENVENIRLYDAAGNETEYFLGATRHRPRPPVEIDQFDFSIGALELILPGDVTEIVEMTGSTTVAVYFEGAQEGDATDDDGDSREEVATQMTDLNLSGFSPMLGPIHVGLNPNLASMGEIEETANNTPGVLDIPPFTSVGSADSFFDIYFQVDVGGQSFFTLQPKRMAGRISHKPPGPLDLYENLEDIPLYDAAGNQTDYFLGAARHRPRPPVEIDQFDFTIAEIELSGGPFDNEIVAVTGPATVAVYFEGGTEGEANDDDTPADNRDEVKTEMLALNLAGISPTLGSVHVTLNPDIASMGEIEETANNTPGVLDIPPFTAGGTADSFFDIYFAVSLPELGMRYFTIVPKRMRSIITHKPPAPGDFYEGLQDIELVNEFGQPTGIFLSAARHRPQPPVEIDEFDFSIGALDVILPDGNTETVEVTGSTTVAVYFEGTQDGDADDDDGNTREEVVTEMVDLNLAGFSPLLGPIHVRLNPDISSMGEIEETANDTPGVLDIPPFTDGGTADSFFDIYFEVAVAGQTFRTVQPKRMSGRITNKPPGPLDWYEGLTDIPLVNEYGFPTGFFLGSTSHRPRPPVEIDQFDFSIGALDMILPDGTTETVAVTGPTTVAVYFEGAQEGDADDDDGDTREEVLTQMTDLNLTGFSPLLGPIHVRLNPYIVSMGEIEETANDTPGVLDIPPFTDGGTADSFFDIYFEIEVAGRTFHTEYPKRMSSRITEKPPAPGDLYENREEIELFNEFGFPTGYRLGATSHTPRPACGAPDTGNCFEPHNTPLCNNAACCQRVCEQMPYCCAVEWSDNCVGMAGRLCEATLVGSRPANGKSLWRSKHNIARLVFDGDIATPAPGELLIQELLPNGLFGPDLSSGFSLTVENDGASNPRILRVWENDSTLQHRHWYAIRNVGDWNRVGVFEVQYLLQVGDADGNMIVISLDVGAVNAGIPCFINCGDDNRLDTDGDGRVISLDVGVINGHIGSFTVPKPTGH